MHKLATLTAFIIFFSLISPAFADLYNCTDNNTSTFDTTINVNGNAVSVNYAEPCNTGCDNISGRCNPSLFIQLLEVIGITAIIFIAVILIAKRLLR